MSKVLSQWMFPIGVWLVAAPVFLAIALRSHGVLRVLAVILAVAFLLRGTYQWRNTKSRSDGRS